MPYNPLDDRTTSTHPLSIGTSMLLESITRGTHAPYDNAVIVMNRIHEYDSIAFNVHTLCRNILSSCRADKIESVNQQHLYEALRSEIIYIAAALQPIFSLVEFYYCEYKNLSSVAKSKHPMLDNTDKQKKTTELIVKAVSAMIAVQAELAEHDLEKIKVYKNNYEPPKQKKLLIVTAQPYNLIAIPRTMHCGLLESHTAKIKSRALWYTKLKGAKTLSWMPFNIATIQIFGDGAMFYPYPKSHRDYTISVGEYFKWDTHTTVDRIRLNISFDRTNPVRHDVLDLL